MNLIVIMLDSLRQDHLGCYGNSWIKTPNIDKLAEESILFENAYTSGLPTIPVRTELFTGQNSLPFRPWQPLTKEDITLPEILKEYGYTSALIASTYHLFKPDMNFHRGFDVFSWIRGQEADCYVSGPLTEDIDDYTKPAMKGSPTESMLMQYLKNTESFEKEEDYFIPQVVKESIKWLEKNYKEKNIFLWMDSFDPHEPWDPPSPFDKMYTDPNYKGPKLIHPKYGKVDWMSEEELSYVRGLYAGEVSFVDKWVGILLEKIKELGLHESSLIVLLSDHGHPHGDHGSIMKTPDNLYSELIRIPLLIRHPEGLYAGKRVDALLQMPDILPTILDIMGLGVETQTMHGKSFWPVVKGEKEKIRDWIVTGYHESLHRCVRDKEWSLILRPGEGRSELYNLKEDPKEKKNLIDEYPEKARELSSHLGRYFTLRARGMSRIFSRRLKSLQLQYELSHTSAK